MSLISEDRKLKEYLIRNAKKPAIDLQNPSSSQVSVGTTSSSVPDSKFTENVTTENLPVVSSSKEIAFFSHSLSLSLFFWRLPL
jgi:hypothetical protein